MHITIHQLYIKVSELSHTETRAQLDLTKEKERRKKEREREREERIAGLGITTELQYIFFICIIKNYIKFLY
jgi:hypothetical protein